MKDPKCPRCGKKTATPSAENNHAFYCHHCKQAFEAIDDGTIGKGDPSRIAERREQREIREKRQASEARRRMLKGGLGR